MRTVQSTKGVQLCWRETSEGFIGPLLVQVGFAWSAKALPSEGHHLAAAAIRILLALCARGQAPRVSKASPVSAHPTPIFFTRLLHEWSKMLSERSSAPLERSVKSRSSEFLSGRIMVDQSTVRQARSLQVTRQGCQIMVQG